jgi:2-dehydro-3-deoxy-D-pentonate aldolase
MVKIITPVVTVFGKDEKPDCEANKRVIDFLIDNGVDGILVLGSTGEFPGLSNTEKLDFFKFYHEYTAGRVPLYAGTGCMSIDDTAELSNKALGLGYTAVLVIGPYYYGIDQEKLYIYYSALAKCLQGDMLLYNYPARSGHSIAPQTVIRLAADNAHIIGIKDSVSEPHHTSLIGTELEGTDFAAFSGFDDQLLYNISFGGAGCIGGLSNIVPDIWHDLIKAVNEKNFDRAVSLSGLIHRLMPIYDMDSNCSLLLKMLLKHRGVDIAPTAIFPYNQIDGTVFMRAAALMDAVLEDYKKLK